MKMPVACSQRVVAVDLAIRGQISECLPKPQSGNPIDMWPRRITKPIRWSAAPVKKRCTFEYNTFKYFN